MRLAEQNLVGKEQGAAQAAACPCHFASAADRLGNMSFVTLDGDRGVYGEARLTRIPEASSKTQLM